ncbi:PH domain-containing protein [Patescibacteria group bacterium]
MFESTLLKYLKEDEKLVRVVRRYWITLFGPILVSAIFIIAPFFFLVPLFRFGIIGVAGFVSLILIGIFSAFRATYIYSLNAFLISDRRIIDIDQHGIFHKTISESPYHNIQDVSVRVKGIGQTLFHFGSVMIQTAGTTANLELHNVKNPEVVQEVIGRLAHEANDGSDDNTSTLSAAELLHLAEKIKEGLTPDQFRKLMDKKTKNE